MKVKHKVSPTDSEVESLFNIAISACLTVYTTPEEQAKAILAAKEEFKTSLCDYINEVFKVGKKIGKHKAKASTNTVTT